MTLLRTTTAVALLAVIPLGCATLHRSVEIDPQATFGAHQEHAALVVDRFDRGRSGVLQAASWLRLPGAPTFVLDVGGETVAGIWLSGSQATVRREKSKSSEVIGEVTPSWENGAIRFALQPAGASAFRTDVFTRKGASGGPGVLTRVVETILDVRGTYEATLRDAKNVAVGWMRVRIGPYQPSPRIYEATLPAAVPPELTTAAAAALDAEIDWIEDHALNVYRGTGGGPLERSIPTTR